MLSTIGKRLVTPVLRFEAQLFLRRHQPRIVAITGSVGKTSTKEAIAAVLARAGSMRKSEKSYNSELGVPLAILGLETAWRNPIRWLMNIYEGTRAVLGGHDAEYLVLEVGADRPGDIKKIGVWLRPHIVVITHVGELPVHVEYFSSPRALADEKEELAKALHGKGTLILAADDPLVSAMRRVGAERVLSYGLSHEADVRAEHAHIVYEGNKPAGMAFTLRYNELSLPITVRHLLGEQGVVAALAAAAVGISDGLEPSVIAAALHDLEPVPGRLHALSGIKGSWILDDSYNASPAATKAALKVLKELRCEGRKIAVLGDMMELGSYTPVAHREVGNMIGGGGVELLYTVGLRANFIAEGARESGLKAKQIKHFHDAESAALALQKELGEGDVVLVKGSQYVRMEKVVLELMQEPDRAAELLVRQEEEWKKR